MRWARKARMDADPKTLLGGNPLEKSGKLTLLFH
jgi:hypothetical protein